MTSDGARTQKAGPAPRQAAQVWPAPIDVPSGSSDEGSTRDFGRVDFHSASTPAEGCAARAFLGVDPRAGGVQIERAPRGVRDAADFAGARVELLAGGDLVVRSAKGERRLRPVSGGRPLELTALEVFGHLYGVAGGRLHVLAGSALEGAEAEWAECTWAPAGLVGVRAALDGTALWLQAEGRGYLFGEELELLEDVAMAAGRRRAYGATRRAYAEWGAGSAAFRPGGESAPGAKVAALGYHGEQYVSSEAGHLKVLGWRPVFFAAQ